MSDANTGPPDRTHHDTTTPGRDTSSATPDLDLESALEQLSRVTVGAQSLQSSLEWIARLTVLAVPGAEGSGVTMLEGGHAETVFVSDPFVQAVDDIQYGLGQGPCITAAKEVRTVVSGALGTDRSWPRFGPRVRDLGVNSVLSVPLVTPPGEVMGALNIYAHGHDVFDADAAHRGEVFATAAAVAVLNARALMQARRLSEQLTAAMKSRATIDQAIGILLSRQGGSPDDAFDTLKRLSQNQNVKLTVVAEGIVREAVQRARARRSGT